MKKTVSRSALLALAAVVVVAVGGCSGMSTRDKSTAVGAGVGAVGGAAVGGVIGNQVGKDKK